MENNPLKKSFMGGYRKKSVHNILDSLADSHETAIASISEEKGKLLDKTILLEKKIEELEKKLADTENEKDYIASAIVAAEKESAKILAEALKEASRIKEEALKEAEELKNTTAIELKSERDQITDLRMSVYQAMQSYKDKLDSIAIRTDIKE